MGKEIVVPLEGDALPRMDGSSHLLDAGLLRGVGLRPVFDHPHGVDPPYAVVVPRHDELLKRGDGKALASKVYDDDYPPCELDSHLKLASSSTAAHPPTLASSWGLQTEVCHHHALALLLPEPQEQMLEEVRHPQYHQGWKYLDGEDTVVVGVDSRILEMPFYRQ